MNYKSKFSKYLRGREELLKAYQQHAACYTVAWILSILLIGAAFFLLWPLLNLGQWGLLGFVALLSCGLIILVRTIRLWRGNVLLLTTERVLDINRTGFFSQTVSQTTFSDIQDISWSRKGLGATCFVTALFRLFVRGEPLELFVHIYHILNLLALILLLRPKAKGRQIYLNCQPQQPQHPRNVSS